MLHEKSQPLISYLDGVTEYFAPKVIGEVNDVYVKVARVKGDAIPWHSHTHEDELFYIIDGELEMSLEGRQPFVMQKGDVFVVKCGITHRIDAAEECLIMLIENKATKHTGEVQTEITRSVAEQLR